MRGWRRAVPGSAPRLRRPLPRRPPLLWRPHERLPHPLLPEPQSTSRRRIGRTSAVRIARACTQRRRSKQPGRRRACPGYGSSRWVVDTHPSRWPRAARKPSSSGAAAKSPMAAARLPRLWKQPVGGGYASFTVAEGRAYTIEQRRDREAITAYDVKTGRELWAFAYPALFDEILGGAGPRATPVYHEGLVYSLGAKGDLYCLSAKTGKPKWSKNILADNGTRNQMWGMAGSPLIVDGMVVVTPGGAQGKSIVAYDRLSGRA